MARQEVMDWVSTRLATRMGAVLPGQTRPGRYMNAPRREQRQWTNPSLPAEVQWTNDRGRPLAKDTLVRLPDGRLGSLGQAASPDATVPVMVETAPLIAEGKAIMLPDGARARALEAIPPGMTGRIEVEVGEAVTAGSIIRTPDGWPARALKDIPPGQEGDVEIIVQPEQRSNPAEICGVVVMDGNTRVCWEVAPDALAHLLDPGLPPALAPDQVLTDAEFQALVDHVVSTRKDIGHPAKLQQVLEGGLDPTGWLLVQSLVLWRQQGLI